MPWILPRGITNKCITSMLEKHIKCKLCFGLDKTIRYVKDRYYPSGNPAISQFHDAPSRIITSISWCCAMIMVYRQTIELRSLYCRRMTVPYRNDCFWRHWFAMYIAHHVDAVKPLPTNQRQNHIISGLFHYGWRAYQKGFIHSTSLG